MARKATSRTVKRTVKVAKTAKAVPKNAGARRRPHEYDHEYGLPPTGPVKKVKKPAY